MNWLNKTWSRKAVLIGLLTHFCAWWAIFAWRWARSAGLNWWLFKSAVAPLYLGLRFISFDQLRVLAIEEIGVFFVFCATAALAFSLRKRWLILLAQLAVALYWLSAAVMIGATTG